MKTSIPFHFKTTIKQKRLFHLRLRRSGLLKSRIKPRRMSGKNRSTISHAHKAFLDDSFRRRNNKPVSRRTSVEFNFHNTIRFGEDASRIVSARGMRGRFIRSRE